MAKVKVGQEAPDFELTANNGRTVSLSDYSGEKNIVLYFYPKDDTSGCTTEACEFRDKMDELYQRDTVILGVSPDGLAAHQRFVAKYDLPFLLLSDESKKICQKYGVWAEKMMSGRKYMGVARTTFVISKNGKVVKTFENVKPKGHSEEILEFVKTLHRVLANPDLQKVPQETGN